MMRNALPRLNHRVRLWPATAVGISALAAAGTALLSGCAATSSSSAAGQPDTARQSTVRQTSGPLGAQSAGAQSPAATRTLTAGGTAAPSARSSSSRACGAAARSAGTVSASASGAGTPALQAIQFADADHGWAAGDGRILATADGGRTWTRQYDGSAALYQVDFADATHGWAVGRGVLLRTTDGGATWRSLREPCTVDTVHFVSPSVGFAVAGGSTVPPVEGSLSGASTGGILLRTSDGGTTWAPVAGTPVNPQSACFTSAQAGYLGTPGRVWRTADGGRSWTVAFTEPSAASSPVTPKSAGDTPNLQCAGPDGAWVLFLGSGAAMSHAPYLAYATSDGAVWQGVLEEPMTEGALRPQLQLPAGPGSEPGPFSAISPQAAAFVGYTPPAGGWGAAPLTLAEGGSHSASTVSRGNVAAINEPLAAAFLSPSQGWVIGENLRTHAYAIVATSDGGHTWSTQYSVR